MSKKGASTNKSTLIASNSNSASSPAPAVPAVPASNDRAPPYKWNDHRDRVLCETFGLIDASKKFYKNGTHTNGFFEAIWTDFSSEMRRLYPQDPLAVPTNWLVVKNRIENDKTTCSELQSLLSSGTSMTEDWRVDLDAQQWQEMRVKNLKKFNKFFNKSFPNYDLWCEHFSGARATGFFAATTPGAKRASVDLDDEEEDDDDDEEEENGEEEGMESAERPASSASNSSSSSNEVNKSASATSKSTNRFVKTAANSAKKPKLSVNAQFLQKGLQVLETLAPSSSTDHRRSAISFVSENKDELLEFLHSRGVIVRAAELHLIMRDEETAMVFNALDDMEEKCELLFTVLTQNA